MRFSAIFGPFMTFLVALWTPLVLSAMQPFDMQNTANALARMAFDLKDLILTINGSQNGGALQVCPPDAVNVRIPVETGSTNRTP